VGAPEKAVLAALPRKEKTTSYAKGEISAKRKKVRQWGYLDLHGKSPPRHGEGRKNRKVRALNSSAPRRLLDQEATVLRDEEVPDEESCGPRLSSFRRECSIIVSPGEEESLSLGEGKILLEGKKKGEARAREKRLKNDAQSASSIRRARKEK